ncbi:MAG: HlyD family efflux transporter periplasmic adaptor subunit [Clostridiales bacterium]|jgi:HlyD family secretion protein|nr:HlyD family efflux transporter periplasmic adaptor subunit [Clostridiales bacterium]
MKGTLIDIKDLSDSKELLLMKPNRLAAIFTCIITALVAAAVTWMAFSNIDVYVNAGGLVRTNESASVVRVMSGGKILSVNVSDGQYVYKGDTLLGFDCQTLYIQRDTNNKDIASLETDIEMLNLYRDSIDALENRLEGIDTDKGRAYSLKVQSFLLERDTALTQVSESEKDVDLQKKSAELKLKNARDSLTRLQSEDVWLQLYRLSVENGQDMISMENGDDTFKSNYASMYQKYAVGLDALNQDKSLAEEDLAKITVLYEIGEAALKETQDAQNVVNAAESKIKSYRQAELSAADAQIAAMAVNIDDAEKTIRAYEQELSLFSKTKTSPLMQVEQARITLLSQIDGEIQRAMDSIDSLLANNAALDAQINDSQVTAPIEGTFTQNIEMSEGGVIASGTEVGAITPPDSDSFKVSLQVSNKDIAGVKLDQPVKFKFLALPYQEYGMVDGFVSQISADSRVNSQTGESFYIVEAVLENKPIKSYRGDDENIMVGMAVEARLISDHKTILRWLLEKMNFE